MRLIDADKLNIYDVSPAYGTYVMGVTEEDIEFEPTVEAIPIEWIKQYGEENCFDFGTQFNAITRMLKAWEERKEE